MNPYGYIEFWNPTVSQLVNLIPYLEENRVVAFIWIYGEVDKLVDEYSDLPKSHRLARPTFLGFTKEEAYAKYTQNRELLMGHTR